MASLIDRIAQRTNDLLAFFKRGDVFQVFRKGFSGNRDAVPVQQTFFEQIFHKAGNSADLVQILLNVFPAGFHVGQKRYTIAHFLEIVDGQLDVNGSGHGNQVKDGIGRSSQCGDDHHGVFECPAGHDIPRL